MTLKNIFFAFIIFLISIPLRAEIIKDIQVTGNARISNETIIMFSQSNLGDNLDEQKLNQVLNNIYSSNFFKNIILNFENNILIIDVEEFPLIQNSSIQGIKNNAIKDDLYKKIKLKSRNSYNEIYLKDDINTLLEELKILGYYFSKVNADIEKLDKNQINITFDVTLGEKSKIKKISFIGNTNFKSNKLRSVILSEEFKFWKFLSSRKFLNEELIEYDSRLLRNFYLNNGFYDVKINSSFAKINSDNEFELIYNIDENKKYFIGKSNLNLPIDFDKENFKDLIKTLNEIEGEKYSIFIIEKILNEIDEIVLQDEYRAINSTVEEIIDENKINLNFSIVQGEIYTLKKINVSGNNITQENVIRNQLTLDEGDIFNNILVNKSINNLNSLNIFKTVESEIETFEDEKLKILNIDIQEKPTGEIMAGVGVGTDGGSVSFAIKENNYLGKGVKLKTEISMSADTVNGIFSIENPNINNSNKSLFTNIQAQEIDRTDTSGYNTKKTGGQIGTKFEYKQDLFLGISPSMFVEKIKTSSKASNQLKKQDGNYFDAFLNLDLDFDKRNQKFQTTDGYRTFFSTALPLVSDSNTLKNSLNYSVFNEFFDDNVTRLSFNVSTATSLNNNDIKLSERIFISPNKLRGFENGKVGPKDGTDYIGGNFLTSLNISSNLPQFFRNSQNLDAIIFSDIANIWGVDYDDTIDDSNKIRSSIGLGIDWFTIVGPLNFSLATPLSKANTDKPQAFRFNLGTTF